MQLFLEVVVVMYYQFPQLPACSLHVSSELQADVRVFVQTLVVLAREVRC